jgi:hypothetical protein
MPSALLVVERCVFAPRHILYRTTQHVRNNQPMSFGLALLVAAAIIYYLAGILWSAFKVHRFTQWRRQLRDRDAIGRKKIARHLRGEWASSPTRPNNEDGSS